MQFFFSLSKATAVVLAFTVTSTFAANCLFQGGCVMPAQDEIVAAINQICGNAYNAGCYNYNGVSFTQTDPSADDQSICYQAFYDIYDQCVDSYQANGGTYDYNGNTYTMIACETNC